MVLLSPVDLVVARTFCGEIAARIDLLLPAAVFSNRLQTGPPRWRFRPFRKAHREMRGRAAELIRHHGGMCRTDIANYYPSINIETLRFNLRANGCPSIVVEGLLALLAGWRAQGCEGIPIGGEAFSVLGNAYALPMDMRLTAAGTSYLRWVDDIFVFGTAPERLAAIEAMDQELPLLDLERSVEKTRDFADEASAMAEIDDGMLASLFEYVRTRARRLSRRRLHERFLEHVIEVEALEPRRFRAILRALQYRQDSFATSYLAVDPTLLNVDPLITGDYLHDVPPTQRYGEVFIDVLSKTSKEDRDLYDARDLHLLRALAQRTWGREEGGVFWDIAMDGTRRPSVRSWAVAAAARTPSWQLEDVLERVLEEPDLPVRRALVLSLYRALDDGRVQGLLRHIRARVPDLSAPAAWVSDGRRFPPGIA